MSERCGRSGRTVGSEGEVRELPASLVVVCGSDGCPGPAEGLLGAGVAPPVPESLLVARRSGRGAGARSGRATDGWSRCAGSAEAVGSAVAPAEFDAVS